MRSLVYALAAFLLIAGLVLSGAARAGDGEAWDDSHMRSRHQLSSQGVLRPKVVLGKDRFDRAVNDPSEAPAKLPPETLDSHTQHSWATGGTQSISFGSEQVERTRSSRGDGGFSGLSRGSQLRGGVSGRSRGGRSSR